ncbi:hypothetical protein [Streptomyces sp. NPDC014995]|uniref:hypothetical protein n=1 Tax=Streptomyces sp. NPDC014995 TaxID=3364936 RepID=UPI0036F940E4
MAKRRAGVVPPSNSARPGVVPAAELCRRRSRPGCRTLPAPDAVGFFRGLLLALPPAALEGMTDATALPKRSGRLITHTGRYRTHPVPGRALCGARHVAGRALAVPGMRPAASSVGRTRRGRQLTADGTRLREAPGAGRQHPGAGATVTLIDVHGEAVTGIRSGREGGYAITVPMLDG